MRKLGDPARLVSAMSKKAEKHLIVPVVPGFGFDPIHVEDPKCQHDGCSLQPAEGTQLCHQHEVHKDMPPGDPEPTHAKGTTFHWH
jgi:hypothetical protein